MQAELRACGERVGRKRVAHLMAHQGLQAQRPRRSRATTDSSHTHPIAPNVLARAFTARKANEAWVEDVTCVATAEGWLYLAVLVDPFARRVVSWATSAQNDTALAMGALRKTVAARRPRRGLLHHTDRGSLFASKEYRAALAAHGIKRSMGRKGTC